MATKAKKTPAEPKAKKVPKIALSEMLSALDVRDREWYSRLTDEQKKEFSPWLVMRYASSVSGPGYIEDHYLTLTNELCNVNFSSLGKEHDELHWLCLQAVGIGKRQMHPFIRPPKRGTSNKLFTWLVARYPGLSDEEIELMIKVNSTEELRSLAEQSGMKDGDIETIFD